MGSPTFHNRLQSGDLDAHRDVVSRQFRGRISPSRRRWEFRCANQSQNSNTASSVRNWSRDDFCGPWTSISVWAPFHSQFASDSGPGIDPVNSVFLVPIGIRFRRFLAAAQADYDLRVTVGAIASGRFDRMRSVERSLSQLRRDWRKGDVHTVADYRRDPL